MGQKSFGYRGIHFWNDLIDEAKGARTYLAFKRSLQRHFHNIIDLTGESFSYEALVLLIFHIFFAYFLYIV